MTGDHTPNSASPSLTERHRADPVKSGGVHYTPEPLAHFVAAQAVAALDNPGTVRVLDPACGDGALLAAVAVTLPSTSSVELHGFDVDAAAVQAAQESLRALSDCISVHLDKVDFLDAVLDEKESQRTLFPRSDALRLADSFDLVIANPPYVRTQVLGADKARRLASDFGLSGRVDLFHAFAAAMAHVLRHGGVMALLSSNRFLTTKSGYSLRKILTEAFEIVTICDLGDTKAFEAAVLPAVLIARRAHRGTTTFPMVSVYEDRTARTPQAQADSIFEPLLSGTTGLVTVGDIAYEIRRGDVAVQDRRSPWVPRGDKDNWVAKVEAAAIMRFRDVGKLRVGVKTTADSVFIRDDWHLRHDTPEAELLLPLITHAVARRWRASVPEKLILYPYDRSAPKRTPVDLRAYPATCAYLELHREILERRRYVIEGGRRWWEIWVPQKPSAWDAPKIVCPDISEVPRFFYDVTGAVVNGDCYWLSVDDERLACLMMAVANSDLGRDYYDAVCGNKLYAGRRRYITQYVEGFPIPDPAHRAVDEIVELVRRLMAPTTACDADLVEHKLNQLVRVSFGLE